MNALSPDDGPDNLDRIFLALSATERRRVLAYLCRAADRSVTDETCDVEPAVTANDLPISTAALAEHLVESETAPRLSAAQYRIDLHHHHLPILDDYGVVRYDASAREVDYVPDPRLEDLLSWLSTDEP